MHKRIAILGVGAIGGVIGAYLARAGRDITLIDQWPASIERIKDQGLTVTAVEEEFTVHAEALHVAEVSSAQQFFDTVILAVKSYDTAWSVKLIEPYLAPGGFVVSAQNSINEEEIAALVGWPRVMGCVVTLSAGMYEPGHVQRTTPISRPCFILGEPSGIISPRLTEMVDVLRDVGPARTSSNLWGERWAKLANNCMSNAVAGFTGLGSAELRENEDSRKLSIRIAAEVLSVSDALGVSVEPITGIQAIMYQEAVQDDAVLKQVEDKLIEFARGIGAGRPSLLQDIMKRRKTEVEHLNGYVVRKGKELSIPTPVNEAVVELTKRVESGELAPSISNLKYIRY